MKFIKFATYESFSKWFTKKKQDDFPLISSNCFWYKREDNVDIYRFVDNRSRPIGICFLTNYGRGQLYIELFEIAIPYNGNGYARLLFNEIVNLYKPKEIELAYPDGGIEARSFWRHLGFKEYRKQLHAEREMYKKFNKSR